MGIAYTYLGEHSRAIGFYKKQRQIARQTNDERAKVILLATSVSPMLHSGEHAKAIDFYKRQLEIHRRIGYVLGEGNALANMGLSHAK